MKRPITFLLFLSCMYHCCLATTRYVTPLGAGLKNGSSWANAFIGDSLQVTINASTAGDEVWVACGTYFTTTGTARTIYFSMKEGVSIYGSFQGNETLLSQRMFTCGPCSVLSAEIGLPGIADNSYKVISNGNLSSSAILDGFIVRDGNDDRAPALIEGLGGGIYNHGSGAGNNSSPTIRNCVITNNRSVFGGGIFNNGYNAGNANPTISHCIITGNIATDGGGGIDNFGLSGNASPAITNCMVYGNTALTAGGMYCWGGNPGGNSSPVILNCAFVNNTATAGNAGGIIADNSNSFNGSSNGNSNPIIRNTIFWGNTASGAGPQFAIKGSGTFNATYSDINMTGQTAPHIISGPGTGNIFTDPLFVNIADANGADNCWMNNDDGLILQSGSPAINAGNNTGVPALDLRFTSRIQNSIVEMGAYENAAVLPIHFLAFSGNAVSLVNHLYWSTTSENDLHHFTIERSADAVHFKIIGIEQGNNSTVSEKQYHFIDALPLEGINYYRLKYISNNTAANNISNIVAIKRVTAKEGISIQINRATKWVSVQTISPVQQLQLINSSGSVINSVTNKQEINAFLPGVYFLKVTTVSGQKTFKVIF